MRLFEIEHQLSAAQKELLRVVYIYVTEVIKGRWPEAEPFIAQDPFYAYMYAKYVIKGRWPEAEPVILTSVHVACWYALGVIKGRWPEAESVILKSQWRDAYLMFLQSKGIEI